MYKRRYKLDAQPKKDAQSRPRRSGESGPLASASGSNTAILALHNGDKSVKYLLHPNRYVAKSSHDKWQLIKSNCRFVIIPHRTKWSLHQIQGGAMNAAHAHVCASLLYKAKLSSNGPSDCQFIHLVSQRNSGINP